MIRTIDDLFQPDVHTASAKISNESSAIPDANSENWESYYKTTHNFYSFWRFEIKYKIPASEPYNMHHIDKYLRESVKEKIESVLAVYCPLHSDVRFTLNFDDKLITLNYDFFADFYYNIPGYMHFSAFIYRLTEYIKDRYDDLLNRDRFYNPYSFGFVADKEMNGTLTQKYEYLFDFYSWAHIIDTLVRCDIDDMDSRKFRDDCRKAKFEVPGSALYDILTVEDPIWISNPLLSSSACLKGFFKFYTKVFGDLAYSVLRDIAKQPENTPYITMHWLFRQINRNIRKNGKEPLEAAWLQKLLD